ncbi:Methyl-accepting chemotaxis protein [Candidatus Desulfosporosinus infrequens]|uniref:Methyl-accepting chemotaxis protein n=1 Tax=Candidatus Desulfosporosinus infrequens TaxID=2043169 RepID=A0A2U3JVD6_9FIRM|nr:Methyl-accepting chemotaxis protein [Candidatus Desulfosporosinus infrequens]
MNLEQAVTIAPFLHQLYEQDITVLVVNTEHVIKTNINPDLDIGVHEGDALSEKSGAYKALSTGKRVVARVNNKALFKIPYIAIAAPLFDNNKAVGAISVIISTEKYDKLVTIGEEVLSAIEEVFATSENLSAQSEELAATAKDMNSETVQVLNDITHVSSIASTIKSISKQSNILGINASIESARAGENGLGFKVVAEEVRKLAEHTKGSATNIEDDIKRVKDSVNSLIDSVAQLSVVSESQAVGATELTKALGYISQLAQNLVEMGGDME